MADINNPNPNNQESIFQKVLDAVSNNRRRTTPTRVQGQPPGLATPAQGMFGSLEDFQQQYLDWQYSKVAHDLYTRTVYFDTDRINSYHDYRAMDHSPEINAALTIMKDECLTRSERGNILEIYSENDRIKNVLEDLFYNRLNIEYSLNLWIRDLLKYGDYFILLHVEKGDGIYDYQVLPGEEIHREEGYDGTTSSVRYRWETRGDYFETWQIGHFRLLEDTDRLPYGKSVLHSARKLWKQLQLAEDAMLVYRITRAPERRIFYVEVGNLEDADVKTYMQRIQKQLKKQPVVNQNNGNVGYRYDPMNITEDYFIPVRGDKSSKIDTLPGACLALDTSIELLDGRSLSLSDIISEFKQKKDLWTYSINPETGEVVPGKITWAGVTRKNAQVLKLTLDNGKSVTVTPDHKFPTRFKGIQEAQNLQKGDSLWSFNRNITTDSQFVFDHSENEFVDFNKKIANLRRRNYGMTSIPFLKKCEECECVISKNDSFNHFNRAKVCSRDCYKARRSSVYKGNKIYNYTGIDKQVQICNFCKTEFKNKVVRKYCSKQCVYDSKIKLDRIKLNCKNCNAEIIKPDNNKNQNFCTRDCKKDYYFKNKNNISNIRKNRKYYKYHQDVFAKIREEANHECQFCFKGKHDKNLDVHHILASKLFERIEDSFNEKNLIPLHGKCHQFRYEDIIANELYNEGYIIKSENAVDYIEFFVDKIDQFYDQLYIDFLESDYKDFEDYMSSKEKKDKNIVHFLNLDTKNCSPNNLISFNSIKEYWNYAKNDIKALFKELQTQEYFNHKIISIEWLEETQDTGTITVDGEHQLHDFHNFALSVGVYTQNSNLSEIQDIEYLQNKLFAALQVPKTYLNYAENLPGGPTLSQADLRFARTINRFQEQVLMELRRIAKVHLAFLGFEDDINNFDLKLTNPSTQQELLKLETMKARLEVFKEFVSSDIYSPASYTWGMKYILGFSDKDIKKMLRQKKVERKLFTEIEIAPQTYKKIGLFKDLDDKFEIPGAAEALQNAENEDTFDSEGGFGGGGGGGGDLAGDPTGTLDLGVDDVGGGDFGGGGDAVGAGMDMDAAEPMSESRRKKMWERYEHRVEDGIDELLRELEEHEDLPGEDKRDEDEKRLDNSLISSNKRVLSQTEHTLAEIKKLMNDTEKQIYNPVIPKGVVQERFEDNPLILSHNTLAEKARKMLEEINDNIDSSVEDIDDVNNTDLDILDEGYEKD